jgi:hypothetical protein
VALYWSVFPLVGVQLQILQPMGKQAQVFDKISRTLLTNKTQEKIELYVVHIPLSAKIQAATLH